MAVWLSPIARSLTRTIVEEFDFPQGLKPCICTTLIGTAKAVPLKADLGDRR